MLPVHDQVSFSLWRLTQIGYEQVAWARLSEPLTTNSRVPAATPAVGERMVVSRFACLIVPWQSHGLSALSHYSLLLCHPALHCVAWFEKIHHFSESPGR